MPVSSTVETSLGIAVGSAVAIIEGTVEGIGIKKILHWEVLLSVLTGNCMHCTGDCEGCSVGAELGRYIFMPMKQIMLAHLDHHIG